MYWAAATAPAMDPCCLSFLRPFPPKKAAPPWETWRITGAFESRAPSRQAMTVEEEVTFYTELSQSCSLESVWATEERDSRRPIDGRGVGHDEGQSGPESMGSRIKVKDLQG